jgi:hypothetical protein
MKIMMDIYLLMIGDAAMDAGLVKHAICMLGVWTIPVLTVRNPTLISGLKMGMAVGQGAVASAKANAGANTVMKIPQDIHALCPVKTRTMMNANVLVRVAASNVVRRVMDGIPMYAQVTKNVAVQNVVTP